MSALLQSLQSFPGHFAAPDWLWLLCVLPLLALLRWRAQRLSARGLPGLVSPRLVKTLVKGASEPLRWTRFLLFLGALAALVLALARPQFGTEPTKTKSQSRDLFVAVDTSRSMLAVDLEPNRLTRARLAIHEIVDSMPEDRIGLIAFAGNGFLLAPLTLDHPAVVESLDQMEPGLVPRGGTNLAAPIQVALEQLRRSGGDRAALIIFSDGEDHEGRGDVALLAKQAKDEGLMVFCVGVGTEAGAIIPKTDDEGKTLAGQFVEDDQGNVVRSRLQPAALQEISVATGGLYVNLGERGSLTTVVSRLLSALEATSKEAEERPRPIERFVWPLAAALFLMTVAWMLPTAWRGRSRRPVPVVAALVFLLVLLPSGRTMAESRDSEGLEALRRNDYEAAISAYEKEIPAETDPEKLAWLQMGLGTAAYRTGDYEKAKQAFGLAAQSPSRDLASQAHYNLGNTLFRLGEQDVAPSAKNPAEPVLEAADVDAVRKTWSQAIDQYRSALTLNPRDSLAKKNLDAVSRYVQVLRKKEEEQKQDEKKEDEKKDDEKKEEEKDKNQDQQNQQDQQDQQQSPQGQPPPQGGPPPPGQNGQQPPPKGQQPEKDESKGQQPPPQGQPKQPPGQPEPQEAPPPDGKLSADPGQAPPPPAGQSKPEEKRSEETGLTPSEARKQLKDNSDEDMKAMPVQARQTGPERYKDW